MVFNLLSLILGNTRAERVFGHVPGDSDSGRDDHLVFIFREGRAFQIVVVHIEDVFVILLVTMVGLDDWVHKRGEGGILSLIHI